MNGKNLFNYLITEVNKKSRSTDRALHVYGRLTSVFIENYLPVLLELQSLTFCRDRGGWSTKRQTTVALAG